MLFGCRLGVKNGVLKKSTLTIAWWGVGRVRGDSR